MRAVARASRFYRFDIHDVCRRLCRTVSAGYASSSFRSVVRPRTAPTHEPQTARSALASSSEPANDRRRVNGVRVRDMRPRTIQTPHEFRACERQ